MAEREPGKVVKVTMNVPQEVFTAWKLLATRRGVSLTEMHRRLVSGGVFIEDALSKG